MNENDFELAERQDQLARDLGTKRAQAAIAPQFHPDFDGEHCVGCGEPLPSVRLAMGRGPGAVCGVSGDRGEEDWAMLNRWFKAVREHNAKRLAKRHAKHTKHQDDYWVRLHNSAVGFCGMRHRGEGPFLTLDEMHALIREELKRVKERKHGTV